MGDTVIFARTEFYADQLMGAVKYANRKSLRRAGAYVRKIARNMIHRSRKSSAPGNPPNTRRGQLKRSILFGLDEDARGVVIGPAKSIIGLAATPHEYGGRFRGRKYPKRPFMGPALSKAESYLPEIWKDSLK